MKRRKIGDDLRTENVHPKKYKRIQVEDNVQIRIIKNPHTKKYRTVEEFANHLYTRIKPAFKLCKRQARSPYHVNLEFKRFNHENIKNLSKPIFQNSKINFFIFANIHHLMVHHVSSTEETNFYYPYSLTTYLESYKNKEYAYQLKQVKEWSKKELSKSDLTELKDEDLNIVKEVLKAVVKLDKDDLIKDQTLFNKKMSELYSTDLKNYAKEEDLKKVAQVLEYLLRSTSPHYDQISNHEKFYVLDKRKIKIIENKEGPSFKSRKNLKKMVQLFLQPDMWETIKEKLLKSAIKCQRIDRDINRFIDKNEADIEPVLMKALKLPIESDMREALLNTVEKVLSSDLKGREKQQKLKIIAEKYNTISKKYKIHELTQDSYYYSREQVKEIEELEELEDLKNPIYYQENSEINKISSDNDCEISDNNSEINDNDHPEWNPEKEINDNDSESSESESDSESSESESDYESSEYDLDMAKEAMKNVIVKQKRIEKKWKKQSSQRKTQEEDGKNGGVNKRVAKAKSKKESNERQETLLQHNEALRKEQEKEIAELKAKIRDLEKYKEEKEKVKTTIKLVKDKQEKLILEAKQRKKLEEERGKFKEHQEFEEERGKFEEHIQEFEYSPDQFHQQQKPHYSSFHQQQKPHYSSFHQQQKHYPPHQHYKRNYFNPVHKPQQHHYPPHQH